MHNGKLVIEWDSYEMPSYGIPEEGLEAKKYGIVGGLGVVSDEVLSRISSEVEILGVGMHRLRGRDLPLYEELDGYRVIRPLYGLYPDEAIKKCAQLFQLAGVEFNGVHSQEIPYLPFLSDYGLAIPKVIIDKDIDLICAHDWMAILGAYEKSLNQHTPLVVFLHSLESGRQNGIVHTSSGPKEAWHNGYYAGSRTIRDIEILGLKKSDICFTVGVNMVKELKDVGKMHGISPQEVESKVYPIHHGVDTKAYRPLSNTEKEYDVIFIGRFAPVKGIMELLDAVKILKSKYPEIRLKLIGGGELEGEVIERIRRDGLEQNVLVSTKWYQREEKTLEINKARIAVAPSKYEPHGQFDLEAGACGVPCINGTGGFLERMIENVTALQCNPFDPRDIAEKIEYLLDNPERTEEIGSNAREFIERYYDWNERAKIYPLIFEAIAEGDMKRLTEIPLVVEVEEIEF
ncbi:MAG: glycosyltransferase family 4 protein [Candidatus Hydrothermarchaeales archaeon]